MFLGTDLVNFSFLTPGVFSECKYKGKGAFIFCFSFVSSELTNFNRSDSSILCCSRPGTAVKLFRMNKRTLFEIVSYSGSKVRPHVKCSHFCLYSCIHNPQNRQSGDYQDSGGFRRNVLHAQWICFSSCQGIAQ